MNRHVWVLRATDAYVRKHQCSRCELVRITATHQDRFPSKRYADRNGVEWRDRAPECVCIEKSPSD